MHPQKGDKDREQRSAATYVTLYLALASSSVLRSLIEYWFHNGDVEVQLPQRRRSRVSRRPPVINTERSDGLARPENVARGSKGWRGDFHPSASGVIWSRCSVDILGTCNGETQSSFGQYMGIPGLRSHA